MEAIEKLRATLLAKKEKIEAELHKYDNRNRLPRKMFFHSLRDTTDNYCRLAAVEFALQLTNGKTVRQLNYRMLAMDALSPAHKDLTRLNSDVNSMYVNTIIQGVTEVLQISLPVCKKSIAQYVKW